MHVYDKLCKIYGKDSVDEILDGTYNQEERENRLNVANFLYELNHVDRSDEE